MSRNQILELFGQIAIENRHDWQQILRQQRCPYLERTCIKTRKSQSDIVIGSCSVTYGVKNPKDIVICPHRFLARGQIFVDCLHLLTLHEPGNELHRVGEVEIPGGSVDYFLVSARNGRVIDFAGIELQSLDTTGTVWPARQQFIQSAGVELDGTFDPEKSFGMNWKMTAKTTLVQMHHKIETFENLGKHLVLVVQDVLLDYMRREFTFSHIQSAKLGHPMQFHAYQFTQQPDKTRRLQLIDRASTDAAGMATALGLRASANVELDVILATLEGKISDNTLLHL